MDHKVPDSYFKLLPRELVGYTNLFVKHMEYLVRIDITNKWLSDHNLMIVEDKLNCINKQLDVLPNLETLTNLTKLNWHSNRLTSLPSLNSLTNLIELNCSNNQLTALPDLNP